MSEIYTDIATCLREAIDAYEGLGMDRQFIRPIKK